MLHVVPKAFEIQVKNKKRNNERDAGEHRWDFEIQVFYASYG
jgi:hypothetical protein